MLGVHFDVGVFKVTASAQSINREVNEWILSHIFVLKMVSKQFSIFSRFISWLHLLDERKCLVQLIINPVVYSVTTSDKLLKNVSLRIILAHSSQ